MMNYNNPLKFVSSEYIALMAGLFVLCSCGNKNRNSALSNRYDKTFECSKNWVLSDLHTSHLVSVCFHSISSTRYLGFIIGISENNDTIGLKYYHDNLEIKIGDTVEFKPATWSIEQKSKSILINLKDDENAFWYCAVKCVYYGRYTIRNAK